MIDLASPHELLEVARNTVQEENDGTHFAPGGAGFSLAWPPAAKVATRKTGRALLRNFTAAIPLISTAGNGTNNGWEDDNGGGLEDIAAMQAIHLMMLQHMCAHTSTRPASAMCMCCKQQSSSPPVKEQYRGEM